MTCVSGNFFLTMSAFGDLHRFFSSHPLSRDRRLAAWRRFLSWQIASRLNDEVVVPWIEGCSLTVRRGMTGATGNVYVGLHEFADMMFILHLLREDDLFFDVGANIGSYTILASGVCGARTLAFEPAADTAACLRRNIATNDLGKRVTVFAVALGDCEKEVSFTVGLDTLNRVESGGAGVATKVCQTTLDTIAGDQAPLTIKIDVEGYEESVIRGGWSVFSNPALKAVEIEMVTPWIKQQLTEIGFRRAYYDPFRRVLSAEPFEAAANQLFIRDEDFVTKRLTTARKIDLFGRKI